MTPETPTLEAVELMRRQRVGCLPVVEQGRLVGILTAYDFLSVSAKLFEQQFGRSASAAVKTARAAVR